MTNGKRSANRSSTVAYTICQGSTVTIRLSSTRYKAKLEHDMTAKEALNLAGELIKRASLAMGGT